MFTMSVWFHWIDLAGVAVFAVSGTLMAHRKHMDGFGVVVLAGVTAIGGGTLRDMILDLPVFWVKDPSFFYVIILAAIATIIWLRKHETFPLRYLLVADAIGLAFFNVMGLQKALAYGATPFVAIALGTMTGVFGGLIRDVICREIPLVLKGELYATTCILGGAVYVFALMFNLHTDIAMLAALLTTLLLRLAAMRWHWNLHVFPPHGDEKN
ncbi:MAG: TRIC cation channel family protein [Aliiglaciecola sp.]